MLLPWYSVERADKIIEEDTPFRLRTTALLSCWWCSFYVVRAGAHKWGRNTCARTWGFKEGRGLIRYACTSWTVIHVLLGLCKPSRGWAFAHSIDRLSTGMPPLLSSIQSTCTSSYSYHHPLSTIYYCYKDQRNEDKFTVNSCVPCILHSQYNGSFGPYVATELSGQPII